MRPSCLGCPAKGINAVIQRKRLRIYAVLVALVSVMAFVPSAGAAPLDTSICVQDESHLTCLYSPTYVGSGDDLHVAFANKCSGAATVCAVDITLSGHFRRVVIGRTNDCSDHAICVIAVHIQGTVNHLHFRDGPISAFGVTFRDRCDSTANCFKSP